MWRRDIPVSFHLLPLYDTDVFLFHLMPGFMVISVVVNELQSYFLQRLNPCAYSLALMEYRPIGKPYGEAYRHALLSTFCLRGLIIRLNNGFLFYRLRRTRSLFSSLFFIFLLWTQIINRYTFAGNIVNSYPYRAAQFGDGFFGSLSNQGDNVLHHIFVLGLFNGFLLFIGQWCTFSVEVFHCSVEFFDVHIFIVLSFTIRCPRTPQSGGKTAGRQSAPDCP